MDKKEISHILEEMGTMMEIKGENPFKIRAYLNAARIINSVESDFEEIVTSGTLGNIKGIGKGLSEKITTLMQTGNLEEYNEIKSSIPSELLDMLKIPGMGPKKVRALWEKLDIKTIGELEYACHENRLVDLPGFGVKTQGKFLLGIENIKRYQGRFLYSFAETAANALLDQLKSHPAIIRVDVAGSLRRRMETCKDIDILASSHSPSEVMDYFTSLPDVESITAKSETKASVILKTGITADLRVVSDKEYPFALHYFTGSKEHNTLMRGCAKKMGIKINEYGFFKDTESILCKNEKEIFSALKLKFIPPELREGTDEIEYAENFEFPQLVEDNDIIGVLHVHTNYSDGINSLEEITEAVGQMGYAYLGICDHSKSAVYAKGLSIERIKEQQKAIDALNKKQTKVKVLKGIEVDILPSGNLDYDNDVMKSFDFVIASVHSKFSMAEDEMTSRIIKALENPYVNILGHPTGRLLLSREGYPLNMKKVIDAAVVNNVAIELNAHPQRLDIDWRHLRYAKEKGILISINPDAHRTDEINYMRYGVGIARKGWLTKNYILNTKPLEELLYFFQNGYNEH